MRFQCMNPGGICRWRRLKLTWITFSIPVKTPFFQATHGYSPFFFWFPISKTRSWTHPVTGYPDLHRILCAKNAPRGTPLKRKSRVPYSGDFSDSWCRLTVFFPRWTYYAHHPVHQYSFCENGARFGHILVLLLHTPLFTICDVN